MIRLFHPGGMVEPGTGGVGGTAGTGNETPTEDPGLPDLGANEQTGEPFNDDGGGVDTSGADVGFDGGGDLGGGDFGGGEGGA